MGHTSFHVIQDFFGEPLDEELLGRIEDAPDDHLVDLLVRLSQAWVAWLDTRFGLGLEPDKHYFLGETLSEVEPMPLEKYKQLAMYFPTIAAPDPMEARLATHLQAAQLVGTVQPSQLRRDMRTGLERLIQIAPLVRAGAIDLVPTVQVRLSQGVQSIARREVEIHEAAGGQIDDLTEAFAIATGFCSMAAYWPVACTQALWDRLHAGGQAMAEELARCNLSVKKALAGFDVPSVRRVGIEDLMKLRANEDAFAEFREAFGVALREALDQRHNGVQFVEQVLRQRLMPHLERCNQAAKRTGAYDGVMLPAGATLMTGGLSWILGIGDVPFAVPDNVLKDLVNLVAPGAAWLAMGQVQRLLSSGHPGCAIYTALLDTTGAP